jgi:Flp pilus assembly protein TadG
MATMLHKVGNFLTHARQAVQVPEGGLWRDQQGAALIYVTVMLGAMFGFAALAIDFGRLATTHTQARAAAEAAALAAASQLDGTPDAITRATNAAQATPLVQNQQDLAQSPGNIAISSLRFLNGLPTGTPSLPENPSVLDPYVTTDPLEARFVEVGTQTLTQNNMFAQAISGGATSTANATAVAGFTQVVCQTVPLAICNPAEADTTAPADPPFNANDWKGHQILMKFNGSGSGWAPGNFGLVDAYEGQGTPTVAHNLAASRPSLCISSLIGLRPGQATNPVRTAINTRFDMYDNPGFGGNGAGSPKNDPQYRPARNVTKGQVSSSGGSACTYPTYTAGTAMALPHDSNIPIGSTDPRFGNGTWDCLSYWHTNHPGITEPGGCTGASTPATMTRYEIYRNEIDNGMIPNNTGVGGENGNPTCSGVTPLTDTPDRRIMVFAVINCNYNSVGGNSNNVPVKAFVKGFLTEPTGGSPAFDTYLEVVDVVKPGADDGILHDIVQLYR